MEYIFYAYVFVVGIVIGSFLNVLVYRIPQKINAVKGSSFCPHCKNSLKPFDLVPIFSYLFLKGKCRYCKIKISPRYPMMEFLTGLIYLLIYLEYGLSVLSVIYSVVVSCFIVLSGIDWDYKIIPDRFNSIIGTCGIAAVFFDAGVTVPDRIIGFFAVSVPVLIIVILTGGMGAGDIKLFAVCGLLLGWQRTLLAFLIAAVLAAVFGVIAMQRSGEGGKTKIPFGPFIAMGSTVALLYGAEIIRWYVSLII